MTSLYFELKKANHNSLSVKPRKLGSYDSTLLEDVKDGKAPEKKHITLDKFFK